MDKPGELDEKPSKQSILIFIKLIIILINYLIT